MLNALYLPDENGNYRASTKEQAKAILLNTQCGMYGFLKNMVSQLEEDEALAMLAEIDHRLDIPDTDFKFNYDVESLGSSEQPYTLVVEYGDPSLGFVSITISDL